MRPARLLGLLIAILGLMVITSQRTAAQTAYGYTEIDYDASSNLVTAYSETDTDYGIAGDYQARVDLEVLNQNYGYVVMASATDDDYDGYVSVTRQFSATSGDTYTAIGTHYLLSYYNYYDYDLYGLEYWYDDWDFEQFASVGIDTPLWYGFTSPGYGEYSVTSPDLWLGETYDSASTSIPYPHPVSFRQKSVSKPGGGVLHFEYTWDSSTNNLDDLSNCHLQEVVTIPGGGSPYQPPPPFFWEPIENPYFGTSNNGALNLMVDNNRPYDFTKPYSSVTERATQRFRYKCDSHPFVYFPISYTIIRSVSRNPNGSWKYTITKNGESEEINPLP